MQSAAASTKEELLFDLAATIPIPLLFYSPVADRPEGGFIPGHLDGRRAVMEVTPGRTRALPAAGALSALSPGLSRILLTNEEPMERISVG